MHYLFLGNTPQLSLLELKSVFAIDFNLVTPAIAATAAELDASRFPALGGTRKVAVTSVVVPRAQVLAALTELLRGNSVKNVAVTDYAELELTPAELVGVKKSLDRPLRFVSLDTTEHELLMLSHQHVLEINLLPAGDQVDLAVTTWIFDAEDWTKRDRAKPYRDIKRGMLPPKLARILVNLGTQGKTGLSLTDPFCGTGTVLSEALLSGCSPVFGSDTFGPAVRGSEANLSWLTQQYGLVSSSYFLFNMDATHLDQVVSHTDLVVTEPYMGPLLRERNPLPLEKIQDIARGLDKLYRGCFKSWARALPVGGRVVMTIPQFAVYGQVIPTISIDTIKALGYNYILSVPYGKPGVTVIRNITILEKK